MARPSITYKKLGSFSSFNPIYPSLLDPHPITLPSSSHTTACLSPQSTFFTLSGVSIRVNLLILVISLAYPISPFLFDPVLYSFPSLVTKKEPMTPAFTYFTSPITSSIDGLTKYLAKSERPS